MAANISQECEATFYDCVSARSVQVTGYLPKSKNRI